MTTPSRLTRRHLFGAACALAALAALTAAAPAGAWGRDPVKGSGTIRRETRDVKGFSGVSLSLAAKVDVRTGAGPEGISIETDDNLLPLIETVVEDGMLKIRSRRGTDVRAHTLRIVVQAHGLDHLSVGGSGDIDADVVRGKRAVFDIGGSGTIVARRIEAGSVGVSVGGSGDLKANDGSVRSASVSIGGSGNVDLGRVRSDAVSVNLAGSGDAIVWARDSLNVSIAGSGDVSYYGDPKVARSVVGSGDARRLGAAPR